MNIFYHLKKFWFCKIFVFYHKTVVDYNNVEESDENFAYLFFLFEKSLTNFCANSNRIPKISLNYICTLIPLFIVNV